jgi:hypothetical protein
VWCINSIPLQIGQIGTCNRVSAPHGPRFARTDAGTALSVAIDNAHPRKVGRRFVPRDTRTVLRLTLLALAAGAALAAAVFGLAASTGLILPTQTPGARYSR